MTDSIYLLQPDSSLIEVSQAPYGQERDLQALLSLHPELLPGAQINPESPRRWLVVRNEAGVPSEEGGSDWWAVDHLLLDQDGTPTFVEVKRSSDTRIRREVVAQMLEYAANGTAYWRAGTLRRWFEEGERGSGRVPEDTIRECLGIGDVEGFWARVEENLQASRVRCIFVADQIPATLRRLVEFLNEHLDTVEVLAVEIPQFVAANQNLRALAPRLVGQTARAQAAKRPTPPARTWNFESFLGSVEDRGGAQDRKIASVLYDWLQGHVDRIDFGKGQVDGSMIAVVRDGAKDRYPFTVWTYSTIEIGFQYLKPYPPFDDETLRRQLLDKLNALPGVSLPAGAIDRRPSIRFGALQDESTRTAFVAILDWIVQQIHGQR